MISRSFRERYGAVTPETAPQPPVAMAASSWPLPRGARLIESPFGDCVVHDTLYTGDVIREAFGRLLRAGPPAGGAPLLSDLIFLDTETTGLSGGTGTHVFLIGVGRFIDDAFHVRQFFMRHPGDEPAVLNALDASIHATASLVTYNGRSFDVPLLETRYRMHGRQFRSHMDHQDLLAPSRAIWKYRLPNCSLGTLERMILGVTRELDAPGWMIPQLYFDYLRSREIRTLEPVFEHNRADIVSLARLAGVVRAFECRAETPEHEIDRLALALYVQRRYPSDAVIADLRHGWRSPSIPAEMRFRALRNLSIALKRGGRYDDAAVEWRAGLDDPSRAVRMYALEELAKHLEHRVRDHDAARELARLGADGATLARDAAALQAFERRLQRLERKLLTRR
ncbi:MAG TPA: ribonuclease H-like domain-containing protein [Thermomicrobiales bacterium]|nr:ribonuclease H-like domain-containing protein [Thermomicrobiales bacterium]